MRTLNAYTVPPQKERKAVQEAREAGLRAYVPTEKKTYRGAKKTVTRRVPVAPGYVFAEGKPYEAKHIRNRVGAVERTAIARLYPRRDVGHIPEVPFKAKDRVEVTDGPFMGFKGVVVKQNRRRGWDVEIPLLGGKRIVTFAADYLRKYEPG